jgi:hypothetical protein
MRDLSSWEVVSVGVGMGVRVSVGVGVDVSVGRGVAVSVGVKVAVAVTVEVGEAVVDGVKVGISVGSGVAAGTHAPNNTDITKTRINLCFIVITFDVHLLFPAGIGYCATR